MQSRVLHWKSDDAILLFRDCFIPKKTQRKTKKRYLQALGKGKRGKVKKQSVNWFNKKQVFLVGVIEVQLVGENPVVLHL